MPALVPEDSKTTPAPTTLTALVTGAALPPDSHTIVGDPNTAFTNIAYDSRQVTAGALFVAVQGERFDGHDFVRDVVANRGAGAVVIEAARAGDFADLPVPRLVVENARAVLAPLACAFFANPTRDLYVAGVTGTNGKTTTTFMIDSIARAHGDTTGTVGTLGATVAGESLPGDRTTPEAPDLQRLFYQMRAHGAQSAAMEVASHALAMGRTVGCRFDVGVFTNLTQDHLDFHKTMDAYRDAKGVLFTEYADSAQSVGKRFTSVLNADDSAGRHYADIQRGSRVLLYSASGAGDAEIRARDVRMAADSLRFVVETPDGQAEVNLPFGGTFNVANALAAVGYGLARRLPLETIARGLAECAPVPGRFQPVRAGQDFAVLVDYAHTPDGLENVLQSAKQLPHNRLIVVFGCGGDRDRTKRPKMGRIAKTLADVAVVTSDNPRTEETESILDEILTGMRSDDGGATVLRDSDRRRAIQLAVNEARVGDVVVIAGKGHENYQIIGRETFPFDDVEVATEAIRLVLGKGDG